MMSAGRNRRFQREMSNTAWQRAMKDMKAAGINPILAAKVGPASTPSGAQATMPDLGATLNSAQSVKQQGEQIDQNIEESRANIQKIVSQTNLNAAQLPVVEKQVEKLGQEIEQLDLINQNAEIQLEFYKNNKTLVNLHKQLGISMTTAGTLSLMALGAAMLHPASRTLLISGLKHKLKGNLGKKRIPRKLRDLGRS
jgi:hypothetical protein